MQFRCVQILIFLITTMGLLIVSESSFASIMNHGDAIALKSDGDAICVTSTNDREKHPAEEKEDLKFLDMLQRLASLAGKSNTTSNPNTLSCVRSSRNEFVSLPTSCELCQFEFRFAPDPPIDARGKPPKSLNSFFDLLFC